MLPEGGRFVTAIKLNRGLRDSNYDQLYAYLKQHETHEKGNKMMLERFSQHTVDPLALMAHRKELHSTIATIELRILQRQDVADAGLRERSSFGRRAAIADDSDVDEAPTAQTMFMANLSSTDPVTDEAGPSYDSEILSEVQDHDHYQDAICAHHEEHAMHDSVQLNYVVDSHVDYTSDSNMISYDQYVKDNEVPVVHSMVSSVPNDAFMMIYNDMCKPHAQSISNPSRNTVVENSLTECVTRKVKIAPHDYSKENFLATFTPQKQSTPEQIFWSQDLIKLKSEALKGQTTRITPTGLTEGERGFKQTKEYYLKEVIPFFKILKDNFKGIHTALTNEIKEMKDVFEELEAEVAQYVEDRKHDAIEQKNLLIGNDNLIAECLSKEVFSVATNSELNVARFTEMTIAHTIVEARCLEFEAELANLRVNSCPNASELQPKSNTKTNRISPAKGVNKLPVEDHPRTNKSHLRTSNRVDSSSLLKRTIVQIVLWYLDSGCLKHMIEDRSRLMNFVKKFIGTVRFRNDHFGAIMGYVDYVIGDSVISRNDVVERWNLTLIEAARTMLIFSKAPIFLWAEAMATACYTQNRSLIHTRHNKTLYELMHNKKPDLTFFRVFGALCYPTNDSEDLGKLQPTADIGIFPADQTLYLQFACVLDTTIALTAYANVDHAGCQDTRRSTSGSAQFLGDKLTTALTSTRFPCIVTIVVSLLSTAITSSTPDTMVDVTVNAPADQEHTMEPLVRTDDQIFPHIRWVPIGKSNCYLDVEKSQSSPIYKNTSAGCYRCHLDKKWFDLTKDTLSDALQMTLVNNNQAFTYPPSSDALINFVNKLGYPKLAKGSRATDSLGRCYSNHINYAERIWEEFTQSIHTFIDDKRNLAQHTSGKKNKVTLIVIPSIRFTKLIIYHLQRKHKFHPRPDSSLHLPNEEPVLGYLKFSAKGTKREVFGMPIPGSLITADIQEASYYQEYLAKVAKHQRYLAGGTRSDPNSPALKPTKPARKPKSTAPKAPPRPLVLKPVSSTQPEPKSAPAKTQGKKRKLTTEMSDKPSKAKKSRHGFVYKKRKTISTPKSVDESVAKDVPANEPRVDDEEADVQRALEESMKSMYDVPRGPLPPVVIKEPEFEKYQPLPEVPLKGNENVTEEQVSHDLLNLQKPKRKSPTDQYIFQRRTSTPTGSSRYDESSSLYAKLGLTDSEEETKENVHGADAGGQSEGQARPDPGAQDEDQSGSNPNEQAKSEDQARLDTGNAEESQPMPSHVVHAGSDREHMDLDVVEVSPQPPTEQIDEGFTAMAYPKVQENLKLMVEKHVLLEEPASSSGTLSSLQHLTKDLSFGDLFFSDKPSGVDNDKATAKTEVESMVHQQLKATAIETTTTSLPPPYLQQQSTTDAMIMKRIDDLKHIMENLIQENKKLEHRLDSHGACLYTLEQLDTPHQVSIAVNEVVTDVVDWAMQAPLQNYFRDLPEADMKEILYQRIWETDSYKYNEDHMQLYEALEKSMNRDHSEELIKDLDEACKKKKKSRPSRASGSSGAFRSSQVPPLPPPPPSTNQESLSKGSAAPSSSKIAASAKYQAWTTTDIRLRPFISLTHADLQMDDDMALDEQAHSSDDEDIESAHIPKVNLRQDWWKPLEEERPATPEPSWSIPSSDVSVIMNNWASALASNYLPPPEDSLLAQTNDIAMFMDWFYKRRGITELKPQDLEGPAFEIVKVCHPDVTHLQYQMEECHKLLTDSVDDSILRHNVSKPLPLGGPPGQVIIQSDFFFNKDLEYLRYGSKGSRPALSISKMKATYYLDVALEKMVPD
uniref:Integrase, catalytic region, zinc finger, CCHC-type, peptidase aspartic, catalytic n=1 Tax=Tanacetum cinerariifolium TaxID=118510 RepID=A0A6L2KM61_TANCI|nr:integrase, catalytic region, zinc finger, CCHC-type, peptidase aspartic, catalytic [Tanacetum cinerariifolium]